QMLHGMADQLKYAAAELNLRVREYVPVGEMIPGMAYLVRRLLENTSNESWLKAGFMDNADAGALLRTPSPLGEGRGGVAGTPVVPSPPKPLDLTAPERHSLSPAPQGVGNGKPFFNEPVHDFADAKQRANFAAAIARATVPRVANDRTPQQGAEMI